MRPQTTLDQAQLALAYLLNQNQVPSGESTRRAFFIASAVERLYRVFDFEVAKQTAALTTGSNGQVNLSSLNLGVFPGIVSINNGIQNFGYKLAGEAVNLHQGDFNYWITLNSSGQWILHTTEPNSNIELEYFEAPVISNAQAAAFTRMVIAKGALIYYRQAQDPEADTAPEEDQFRQEVSETMDAQQRRRPQQFAQSPRDRFGHGIGEV